VDRLQAPSTDEQRTRPLPGGARGRIRLAELVAALSLGIDLGFGQPMEHVLRQCLIALRLAERVGLTEGERAVVYYTALVINVGCHTDAHEQAKWFGEDLALKATKYDHPFRSLRGHGRRPEDDRAGHPVIQRFRIGVEFAVAGHRELAHMLDHHGQMARALAAHLGLSQAVLEATGAAYEQWYGKGWPGRLRGEDVPIAARISQIAEFAEVAHRVGGVAAVRKLEEKPWSGQFDPRLVHEIVVDAGLILADLDQVQTWDAVIEAEPSLAVFLTDEEFDGALEEVANFVDLKSPYLMGHARAVSELAGAAAMELKMRPDDVRTLRRAALVQGFGRLGVSNAIWDKRGPLGAGEWERVRLHPYLTERMLRQSPALAPLGAIAVQLRERLDGSGYPRALSGVAISRPARVLAAADAYQAMRERGRTARHSRRWQPPPRSGPRSGRGAWTTMRCARFSRLRATASRTVESARAD
jgi:HD-GYP domain-containing protein (c-di-GMP phosphodiesterase class II)